VIACIGNMLLLPFSTELGGGGNAVKLQILLRLSLITLALSPALAQPAAGPFDGKYEGSMRCFPVGNVTFRFGGSTIRGTTFRFNFTGTNGALVSCSAQIEPDGSFNNQTCDLPMKGKFSGDKLEFSFKSQTNFCDVSAVRKQATPEAVNRTAKSGTEIRIAAHGTWGADCQFLEEVVVVITKPPVNGVATLRRSEVKPDKCSSPVPATGIFYKSNPGFAGTDTFSYDRKPDSVSAASAGVRNVTVDVKP